MAHFAKINNNIVEQVIVISNAVLLDTNGQEQESLGASFCHDTFGGEWLQTSYNGSFRGRFASAGMIYNNDTDTFEYPTVQGGTSE